MTDDDPLYIESLVTLLEIAAVTLAATPETVFTASQLLATARTYAETWLGHDLVDGHFEFIIEHYADLLEPVPGGFKLR